jgi:hypothetical protein
MPFSLGIGGTILVQLQPLIPSPSLIKNGPDTNVIQELRYVLIVTMKV